MSMAHDLFIRRRNLTPGLRQRRPTGRSSRQIGQSLRGAPYCTPQVQQIGS
jgi:hypothetical protein